MEATKPPQLTEDAVREIEARANAATEGPWESDNEQDSEHRYQFYMALDAESRTIFDTLNSSVGEIHEEADEDGVYRWDEVARRNIAFATHARTDIPALIRDWRAMQAENEVLEQFNIHLTTGLVNIYHVMREQLAHAYQAVNQRTVESQRWADRWLTVKNERDELQSQLAHRTVELEHEGRETQKWNNRANQLAIDGQKLQSQLAEKESRIIELERRLRIPFGKFPCAQCGGPHDFDTSVPSVMWNRVIRAKGLPEYLCTTCIVREFVRAGESFTAELWNEEFNGVPIEVVVNGQNAKDAAAIQEENNSLCNQLAQVTSERDAALRTLHDMTEATVKASRKRML